MKILVDADACPVKNIIEAVGQKYSLPVIMVSNQHHTLNSDYAQVQVVDAYSQSADIHIVNQTDPDDIVITQDYGLAAMVLAKGAHSIHPDGRVYTSENIESLLMQRYINQKAREAGSRTPHSKKRTRADDQRFREVLVQLVERIAGSR